MKSIPFGGTAGNAKLKGKLQKILYCGCCCVTNFKWRERLREANKEISDSKKNLQQTKSLD